MHKQSMDANEQEFETNSHVVLDEASEAEETAGGEAERVHVYPRRLREVLPRNLCGGHVCERRLRGPPAFIVSPASDLGKTRKA